MSEITPNMEHVPFGVYQQHIQRVLGEITGLAITKEWWDSQTIPSGQHRTWLHYKMGLSIEQSAEELRPFADAQLRRHYEPERFQDICISFEKM